MYDVIIIGAGPAGLAAAMHTMHQQFNTLMIAPDLAGKARYRLYLPWMKERERVAGEETVEQLRQTIISSSRVTRYLSLVESIIVRDERFHVETSEGGAFVGRAVIVASGLHPQSLGVPGEQRLMGYGVSYSAITHAQLFAGRRVVVVGNNPRALHSVAMLRTIAGHVTLIASERIDFGSTLLGPQLLNDERVSLFQGHEVREITGDEAVSGVVTVGPDGSTHRIETEGVFIEAGLEAPTGFLGKLVDRAPDGRILIGPGCATRTAGLFAAGDVTSTSYAEHTLVAIGEGTKAGLHACSYLAV